MSKGNMMIRGQQFGAVGSFSPLTATQSGSQRVAFGDAQYFDPAHRRQIFWASNQVAATWSVALNATHTGLVVSNPIGSSVDLVMVSASFALSVAPAGIATIGLFTGFYPLGLTVHTTPETPLSSFIGPDTPTGQARADAAATLPGTPRWVMPIQGGFTAGALPATSPSNVDLKGLFIIQPGAYFGIGALTAVVGFGGLMWVEVPNEAV
jgi:hypothetical protein